MFTRAPRVFLALNAGDALAGARITVLTCGPAVGGRGARTAERLEARIERMRFEITCEGADVVLAASGAALAFDGHLNVRGEDGAGPRPPPTATPGRAPLAKTPARAAL